MTMPNDLLLRFKRWPTFTIDDAFLFLNKKHRVSRTAVQVTLSRMVKSKRLFHVTKGVFSLSGNAAVAGFAYTPFYYGCLSALMIMELIDDQVKMEVMTTRNVRRTNTTVFGDVHIILHHLPRKYYFGFRTIDYGGIAVPVSVREKTLIDMFYYNVRVSASDYSDLLKSIDLQRLHEYLDAYPKKVRNKVLSFVKEYRPMAIRGELENPY